MPFLGMMATCLQVGILTSLHTYILRCFRRPLGCKNQPGRIVRTQKRSFSKQHLVLDDVISDELAQQVYDYTTTRETKVWGVYIHEAQIATARSSNANANSSPNDPDSLASDLATRVIQEFLYQHAKCKSILDHDRAEIHGIAVWAIASSGNVEKSQARGTLGLDLVSSRLVSSLSLSLSLSSGSRSSVPY